MEVTFQPVSTGIKSTALTVTSDAQENSLLSITLTGEGIAPVQNKVHFYEDFEESPGTNWTAVSTNQGRIRITGEYYPHEGNSHCLMDAAVYDAYSLNEMVLELNLRGRSNVLLSFRHKTYDGEQNTMPYTFSGSVDADGMAVSNDGLNWYRIEDLTASDSNWLQYNVDLDAAVNTAGISLTR